MVRMGVGFCLCLFVYYYRHIAGNKEVGRMNPQPALKFLPIPTPNTEMIVAGSIAVGLLLAISVFLGLMGRLKMKKGSFDEYLVGKRDLGPVITGAALSATYISGWAFCGSTGIVYSVGFSGMWFAGIWSLDRHHPVYLARRLENTRFLQKTRCGDIA